MIRTPLVAANWKLNFAPSRAGAFVTELLNRIPRHPSAAIALFPPAISLSAARHALRERPDILLGVQNVYWESSGAFTGEISAPMAADAGAQLALVGHSERRHVFGETDGDTARKVGAVFAAGLTPILCVGELLDERDAGAADAVVERQLKAVLNDVRGLEADRLIIAYEPVWAIGTGRTASPRDASDMHRTIREILAASISDGARVPILYGGSVKPENSADLLAARDVDGLLVGGASLDAEAFAKIVDSAP